MPNISDTVTTPDGSCPVRLFTPEGQRSLAGRGHVFPTPAVRAQTFFDMAAKLADSGYAVLLPDVYYRQGDWAPFDMKTAFSDDNERKRLMSFIGSITPDKWASDANAYFDYLSCSARGQRHHVRHHRLLHGRSRGVDRCRAGSGPGRGRGVVPRRWVGHRQAATARICGPTRSRPSSMWAGRRTTRRSPTTTPSSSRRP